MTKQDVIDHFGSAAEVARQLKITRVAVCKWDEVPLLRQMQIEQLTGGKLKAENPLQAAA